MAGLSRASARKLLVAVGVLLLLVSIPALLLSGDGSGQEDGPAGESGEHLPSFLLVNRLTGLLGLLLLASAALLGILRRPGWPENLGMVGSSVHYYVALPALLLVLLHSAVGLPGALNPLLESRGPVPAVGMLLGPAATILLLFAALAHLTPWRLPERWRGETGHAAVYTALAVTVLHSGLTGHEAVLYASGTALLLLVLGASLVLGRGSQ